MTKIVLRNLLGIGCSLILITMVCRRLVPCIGCGLISDTLFVMYDPFVAFGAGFPTDYHVINVRNDVRPGISSLLGFGFILLRACFAWFSTIDALDIFPSTTASSTME